MLSFLFKGLLRDRSRSFFPLLVISLGVAMVVFMQAYITGAVGGLYRSTARFNTGHVKVLTQAAVKANQQSPDLALLGNGPLLNQLEEQIPQMSWHERIYFGALLDAPDAAGETKFQATASVTAVDLLSPRSEVQTLNLKKSLASGRLPESPSELLIAQVFMDKMGLQLGDPITLIGGDVNGGMAVGNFKLVGTLRFGVIALDRSALVMELRGAQEFLALGNGATAIFGFYRDGNYFYHRPEALVRNFNAQHPGDSDPYGPVMLMLEEQDDLESLFAIYAQVMTYVYVIFILIMGIVLWNTGLMSGIRRYSEMGVRLAMGETKRQVYGTLLLESLLIGLGGTLIGTALGLIPAYWMQEVGIDITAMMTGEMAMLFEDRIRAQVVPATFVSGLLPGIAAPLLGALVSGLGIFRRDTSRLFVELEV
ncbi:MAG: FtsX-like permease family protein [bacterium]|nr:FtsX-like permease family protein [bacterium]